MIRDYNIAKDAGIQLTKILGATMAGQIPTGEIFWVGDSGDAAYNSMRSRVAADRLYTDLDTCVGACTANRGDIIVCMEGYNKSVIAAGGLDLDVAGITIVFLGTGTSQAKITFSTATSADMDVDAADITMIRPKFVAAIDALAGPIDVNSTDFTIIDGEYHDGTAINTTDAIVATSGATRLKIDGWKFFDGDAAGTQKQSHIQLNGVDNAVLKRIYINGDFETGNIENVTDEVLNIELEDIFLKNANATPKPGMVIDANATGVARNVHIRIASGTTFVSNVGKINWGWGCLGFNADGGSGDQLGTAISTGLEGVVDKISSDLIVTQSDVKVVISGLTIVESDVKVALSGLTIIESDVKVALSGLTIIESDVKVALSGLTIVESDVKVVLSGLTIVESDVKVALSGLTIIESDIKAFRTAWDTFETLVSDFIVKYESDNP